MSQLTCHCGMFLMESCPKHGNVFNKQDRVTLKVVKGEKPPTIGYQSCAAELIHAIEHLNNWTELKEIKQLVNRLNLEVEYLNDLNDKEWP